MSYKLYIDDERLPPESRPDFILAKTYHEAITIIEEKGIPEHISFDYYLDRHFTGLDVAMWLITHCEYHDLEPNFTYQCHSSDKSARRDLVEFLDKNIEILKKEKINELEAKKTV